MTDTRHLTRSAGRHVQIGQAGAVQASLGEGVRWWGQPACGRGAGFFSGAEAVRGTWAAYREGFRQ
ncbi:hypothetical protein [Acetobacter musti]|nr:hypothetical protein [Acetobacter musti]